MTVDGEPFGDRVPTSHERRSGQSWDASYRDGPAPWEFGGPQPAIVRLAARGAFTGSVLDAGCGSGDNSLHLASSGLSVVGVDVAATALATARGRAAELGLDVEFAVGDAFHLDALGRSFDTVLDSGLFHTFDADEQRSYAESLASVTRSGGTVHVLCFGDVGPDQGPHPVTPDQLRAAFAESAAGWWPPSRRSASARGSTATMAPPPGSPRCGGQSPDVAIPERIEVGGWHNDPNGGAVDASGLRLLVRTPAIHLRRLGPARRTGAPRRPDRRAVQ